MARNGSVPVALLILVVCACLAPSRGEPTTQPEKEVTVFRKPIDAESEIYALRSPEDPAPYRKLEPINNQIENGRLSGHLLNVHRYSLFLQSGKKRRTLAEFVAVTTDADLRYTDPPRFFDAQIEDDNLYLLIQWPRGTEMKAIRLTETPEAAYKSARTYALVPNTDLYPSKVIFAGIHGKASDDTMTVNVVDEGRDIGERELSFALRTREGNKAFERVP